jgi:hypothetical protein
MTSLLLSRRKLGKEQNWKRSLLTELALALRLANSSRHIETQVYLMLVFAVSRVKSC